MKAEYQKIADDVFRTLGGGSEIVGGMVLRVATEVAERCEALANKPVRELTDDECLDIWNKMPDTGNMAYVVRNIVSLYIAKQSEPDEIPFDQKKLDEGGWDVKLYYTNKRSCVLCEEATKVTLVRKT